MNKNDEMIEVTTWNADGTIAVHEFCKAQIATSEQIDEMIKMIETGIPAYIASGLVLNDPSA